MALTVTHANTVSHQVYGKKYKENVYDSSPFTRMLMKDKKIKIRGGTQISFPVDYKELARADTRDWNDEVVYESVDTWTQAILQWIHIDCQVMITKEERFKNASGPNQIVDVIKSKEEKLRKDEAEQIADQIFASTTATGDIACLADILDSTGSYAGISPTDATVWAGNEDTTTTQMTRAFLYGEVAGAQFGEDGPSVHFTTRTLLAEYNALLGADERYHNTRTANAGFKTITLYGDNVYADSHVASSHWYGLDYGAIELWLLDGVDMTPTDWFDLKEAGHPKALAKYVDAAMNLIFYRRRTSFKCTALTGT